MYPCILLHVATQVEYYKMMACGVRAVSKSIDNHMDKYDKYVDGSGDEAATAATNPSERTTYSARCDLKPNTCHWLELLHLGEYTQTLT